MAIHDAPKDILSGTCSFQKVELKYGIYTHMDTIITFDIFFPLIITLLHLLPYVSTATAK